MFSNTLSKLRTDAQPSSDTQIAARFVPLTGVRNTLGVGLSSPPCRRFVKHVPEDQQSYGTRPCGVLSGFSVLD